MSGLNATHDPTRRSWLESANRPGSDFPIQNLPFGIFSAGGTEKRVGVAIGDQILDLTGLEEQGAFRRILAEPVFDQGKLNPFMALPRAIWSSTRAHISTMLDHRAEDRALPLVPQSDATMHLPFFVRAFTDFYASREHATNVGSMFRDPENALLPNWLHMPIGYNGRASTVVVSGTAVHRPLGQLKPPGAAQPGFGPSQKLDFELELGAVVGTPTEMGSSVSTREAYDRIFGYVLLNDWSARDLQVWEYQPLGPFQSKAFATSISPWVVTAEALEPCRVPAPPREVPLLPYLSEETPNNFNIELEVRLRPDGGATSSICRTNAAGLYYSAAQQFAHHTVSGCAMETGDLLGSGTISGPAPGTYGSMLELTRNGDHPLPVSGGTRRFIEDGDTVEMTGWCEGAVRIGFGSCVGQVLPARGDGS